MQTIPNHQFWRTYFATQFVPHIKRLFHTLDVHLLPALGNIEAEADEIEKLALEYLTQSPIALYPNDEDTPKRAREEAATYYYEMKCVQQTLLNTFAILLYHAWEQQLLEFHRYALADERTRNNGARPSVESVCKDLLARGINLSSVLSWETLDELRLVANTAKHAEGNSANMLRERRPDLFILPSLSELESQLNFLGAKPVSSPLSGEHFYVTREHLRQYENAAVSFWEQLANAIAGNTVLNA